MILVAPGAVAHMPVGVDEIMLPIRGVFEALRLCNVGAEDAEQEASGQFHVEAIIRRSQARLGL